MGTEFSYLILLLIGVVILLENRLKRLVLLAFQSVFLLVPLFEGGGYSTHSLFLAGMILLFKVILTPWILFLTLEEQTQWNLLFPKWVIFLLLLFF
ncbi:hypothetical protein LEP1GSC088_4238 [Leptospira interrogans str. L1207]|nr:hypothetical protein LEP1GSC088_4238 [Leptospira interrogans str. L1207]